MKFKKIYRLVAGLLDSSTPPSEIERLARLVKEDCPDFDEEVEESLFEIIEDESDEEEPLDDTGDWDPEDDDMLKIQTEMDDDSNDEEAERE